MLVHYLFMSFMQVMTMVLTAMIGHTANYKPMGCLHGGRQLVLEKWTHGQGKQVGLGGQMHEEAQYCLHYFYATQDVCMSTMSLLQL